MRIAVKERVKKEEYAFRLVEKMVLLDCVDKEFFLNAVSLVEQFLLPMPHLSHTAHSVPNFDP